MNDPEKIDSPEWWLQFADEELLAAETRLVTRAIPPRHSCYLAQQAAEKAIKPSLVYLQVDFPFTHNLESLLELLPPHWEVQQYAPDLAFLSEFAVTARYPGDWTPPTEDDAQLAVEQARTVIMSMKWDISPSKD